MSTPFHFTDDSLPALPLFVVVLWMLVWLVVLGAALARKDLDPVTRLTWVLVIIMVPFFGVVLYWILGPKQQASAARPAEISASEPIGCIACGTEMPAGASGCPKCGWSYENKPAA
jgi:hypothetical protein